MSPGRVVLLTHRGPAAELLARELEARPDYFQGKRGAR